MGQQQQIGTHKTSVSTTDGYTRVTYHSTDVVKFNSDEIILNSGGYRTNTTKTRMNQASNQLGLGYQVFQKNFDWFVDYKENSVPFTDNITLKR